MALSSYIVLLPLLIWHFEEKREKELHFVSNYQLYLLHLVMRWLNKVSHGLPINEHIAYKLLNSMFVILPLDKRTIIFCLFCLLKTTLLILTLHFILNILLILWDPKR